MAEALLVCYCFTDVYLLCGNTFKLNPDVLIHFSNRANIWVLLCYDCRPIKALFQFPFDNCYDSLAKAMVGFILETVGILKLQIKGQRFCVGK